MGAKAISEMLLVNSSLTELYIASHFKCKFDITALRKSYLLSSAPLIEFRPKSYISLKALRKVFRAALQIDPERVYMRLVSRCRRNEELRPLLLQIEAYRKVCLLARFEKKSLPRELLISTLKYLLL